MTCSTSRIVPVTRLAGSASALATPAGKAAVPRAAPAASCRNALRSPSPLVIVRPRSLHCPRQHSRSGERCGAARSSSPEALAQRYVVELHNGRSRGARTGGDGKHAQRAVGGAVVGGALEPPPAPPPGQRPPPPPPP